jgi:hypothetical protein
LSPSRTISGAVWSSTVTVTMQVAWLPLSSVAVSVTTVAPRPIVVPAAGDCVIARSSSQASVAVAAAARSGTVARQASSAAIVGSSGQVSSGSVVSTTVTVNVHVAVLPASSVARHVTVVVPIGNVLPEAGEQATATAASQSSVATGVS